MTASNDEQSAVADGHTGSGAPAPPEAAGAESGARTVPDGGHSESGARVSADGGGASIDKVRDLLFGSQLRELDRRFARLEERLVRETGQLREDLKARLEASDAHARTEADSLADQIRAERADRGDAHDNLARELKDTTRGLDRRTIALDDQLSRGLRDLRQQVLDQHQRLEDEVRRRTDELLATLTREVQALRAGKTDRSALAALLNEMALRLTDEDRAARDEDGGNG
jgi:hypothetical protein